MKAYPSTLRTAENQVRLKPVYCYRIEHVPPSGSSTTYYLAGYDSDVTITGMPAAKGSDPQVFTATQVGHKMPEQTLSLSSAQAVVSVALPSADLRKYFASPITNKVKVEIYRINTTGLPGTVAWANDVYIDFKGIGGAVGFNDYQIDFSVGSLILQQDGRIARYTYQKMCNHVLGGEGCFVNMEAAANKLSATISAINRINRMADITNTTINGVAITAYTFQGGYLKRADGTRVNILTTTLLSPGVRMRLQWWPLDLAVSEAISVYRGCRLTKDACNDDFNNLNGQGGQGGFGGMPGIPNSNPTVDGIEQE